MSDLYRIMKGKAYRLAETIIASKHQGEDLLQTIMSDSDHTRQPLFLSMLPQVIPAEAHRQILLDGLAREYAGVEGWMAYVERETSDRSERPDSGRRCGGPGHDGAQTSRTRTRAGTQGTDVGLAPGGHG